MRLKSANDDDFLVFRTRTWRWVDLQANTYPGAQCDIPSVLYLLLLPRIPGLDPPVSPAARTPVLSAAMRGGCRDRAPHPAGAESRADWDELAQVWRITGLWPRQFTATVLIMATGPFSEPSIPDLPGLDDSDGPAFHSAQWRHDPISAARRSGSLAPARRPCSSFRSSNRWRPSSRFFSGHRRGSCRIPIARIGAAGRRQFATLPVRSGRCAHWWGWGRKPWCRAWCTGRRC